MCEWGNDVEVKLFKPKEFSKKTTERVDSCLAPLVQMLNDYGIETRGCCCGHGKSRAEIMIHFRHIDIEPIEVDGKEMPRVKLVFNQVKVEEIK